jgi:hypothetical protein
MSELLDYLDKLHAICHADGSTCEEDCGRLPTGKAVEYLQVGLNPRDYLEDRDLWYSTFPEGSCIP